MKQSSPCCTCRLTQVEVQRLRDQLAEKELLLSQTSAQLASTSGGLQRAQAPFSRDLTALEHGESQLSAQEAALAQQEELLQGSRAQALARREAVEAKRSAMQRVAGLLEAAAVDLAARAEALRRGALDGGRGVSAQHDLLLGAFDGAAPPVSEEPALAAASGPYVTSSRAVTHAVKEDPELTALTAERLRLERSAEALVREAAEAAGKVPELAAATKEAAARRDFKVSEFLILTGSHCMPSYPRQSAYRRSGIYSCFFIRPT